MMPKDYNEKLLIIKDMMDELIGEMEYGPEDLDSRLGRKKPEAVAIEVEMEGEEMPMGEIPMDEEGEEEDEDSMFMKRVMALKK